MTDYKTIMVNGKIPVVWDGRTAHCKKCNATIGWGITTNNKKMPFDLVQIDSTRPKHEAHWSTCPNRDDFRRVDYGATSYFPAEEIKLKLTEEEMRAVGFRPEVSGYDAIECQYLNEQLAMNLAGYKSLSQEWWLKAKEIHQRARSLLRCCG